MNKTVLFKKNICPLSVAKKTLISSAIYLALLSSVVAENNIASKGGAMSKQNNKVFTEGFENSANLIFQPAKDYATVEITKDALAPEGTNVLHFSHQRTRTSTVSAKITLEPYSSYLVTYNIRKGKHYLKSGMGVWIRFFADGNEVVSDRFFESSLSETWQLEELALVTGKTGVANLQIQLHNSAGDIFIDNLKIQKCERRELFEILDSGSQIPLNLVPLRPGEAEARVWYDEIPVSEQVPSEINFQFRENLADGVWNNSRMLKLELPDELEVVIPKNIKFELVPKSNCKCYTFDSNHIKKIGNTWVCSLLIKQTRALKEGMQAKFWAQWESGKQIPVEVSCMSINIPVCKQPINILTGCQNCSMLLKLGDKQYIELVKNLGFNLITCWKLGAGARLITEFQENGIKVETEHSGHCEYDKIIKDVKDAQSINIDGKVENVINPGHRGVIFDKMLSDVEDYAKLGFSGLAIDDEYYSDWRGMLVDMSDNTKKQWAEWMRVNYPELKVVMPEIILDDPINHLKEYNAWWLFRMSLMTEWYAEVRKRFVNQAVKHTGKSNEKPWMSAQIGRPVMSKGKTDLYNYNKLLEVFDYFSPQLYMNAYEIRSQVADLVRVVGKEKALPLLCMGEARTNRDQWKKGEVKAQILEILFAGAKGYGSWGWPYSNLRIVAEFAQTNNAIAENEDIFVHGEKTNSFYVEDQTRQFASALETDKAGLLLISNYTKTGMNEVIIRKFIRKNIELRDVFTDNKITLPEGQEFFIVNVKPGTCALYRWNK